MPSRARWWLAALWPMLALGLTGLAAAEPEGDVEPPATAVAQLPAGHAAIQRDRLLSAAARTALNSVRAAARVIAAGDPGLAKPLLAQAQRILDQIQADLEGRGDPAMLALGAIPVLARVRLSDAGEIDPAVAVRIEALEPLILTGEHEEVLARLQGIGAALTYDYVGMPVQATSNGVRQASAALAAGDNDTALAALRAIVQGLDARTVTIGPAAPGPHPTADPSTP